MNVATSLPRQGSIAVLSVTNAAQTFDLSDSSHLGTLVNSGRSFIFCPDVDVYVLSAFASPGTAVSGAATTGNGRGALYEAKKPVEFFFEHRHNLGAATGGLNVFLSIVTVTGTGLVRIWLSERQHG